jgi:hypothetical protein
MCDGSMSLMFDSEHRLLRSFGGWEFLLLFYYCYYYHASDDIQAQGAIMVATYHVLL